MRTAFCFDLDGTVTKEEILPLLSREIGLYEEISALTEATIKGLIPFRRSFLLRCRLLAEIPVSRVQEVVSTVGIYDEIQAFIKDNAEDCYIVTGNLDVWISSLAHRLPCKFYSSTANVEGDKLTSVDIVINKAEAIQQIRKNYDRIVAIGDGMGDIPMFQNADLTVAFGGVHPPIETLLKLSDFVIFEPNSLVGLLENQRL